MVVFKFGGTSVQDAPAMEQVFKICSKHLNGGLVLVSSAMAGVTNQLVALTDAIQEAQRAHADRILDSLEKQHSAVIENIPQQARSQALEGISTVFSDIRTLVKGSFLLGECSARVSDAIWASGELLSTAILYALSQSLGFPSKLLDARKLIVTDENFGNANVIWDLTTQTIREQIHQESPSLWIVQGFIGSTVQGVTTTLGRGGSDYSASIFGACLSAKRIEIWTDVDGIMTTDPRKVPSARTIPELTYAEAAELAFFGAKVVHPATIQPAVESGIPVWVKNTKKPELQGTLVKSSAPGTGLRAIAGRKGAMLITITSSRMLMAYGFLKRIFSIFDHFKTSVDLVATSEVSVSVTINETQDVQALLQALEELGSVRIENSVAIVSLVGQDLWKQETFLVRAFQALNGIPVLLISMGSSEINLSMVVREQDLDGAVEKFHAEFFDQIGDNLVHP
jgi:aspartate kinase